MVKVDVLIIGAGAAGLMCAIEAGKRGRKTFILDSSNKPGKKIIMSGGGRCNFTNLHVHPDCYISQNPHFCKSALKRYTQWDFIDMVKSHKIPFHEKEKGQLFCDNKSVDILNMLLKECETYGVKISLNTHISKIEQIDNHFKVYSSNGDFHAQSVVVATGGLSIPTLGSSPFGYKIAEQFGIPVVNTKAGLVPFTLGPKDKEQYATLSGIACEAVSQTQGVSFEGPILFTHRGVSGPSILQISSYWQGHDVSVNLMPNLNITELLQKAKKEGNKSQIKTLLAQWYPKKMIAQFLSEDMLENSVQNLSNQQIQTIHQTFKEWTFKPSGTEGYRTAEVTLGGVDCAYISSKTFEANTTKGLYFIGEVLDVSGWLGGYNFAWAWSSGWAAGQVV